MRKGREGGEMRREIREVRMILKKMREDKHSVLRILYNVMKKEFLGIKNLNFTNMGLKYGSKTNFDLKLKMGKSFTIKR